MVLRKLSQIQTATANRILAAQKRRDKQGGADVGNDASQDLAVELEVQNLETWAGMQDTQKELAAFHKQLLDHQQKLMRIGAVIESETGRNETRAVLLSRADAENQRKLARLSQVKKEVLKEQASNNKRTDPPVAPPKEVARRLGKRWREANQIEKKEFIAAFKSKYSVYKNALACYTQSQKKIL